MPICLKSSVGPISIWATRGGSGGSFIATGYSPALHGTSRALATSLESPSTAVATSFFSSSHRGRYLGYLQASSPRAYPAYRGDLRLRSYTANPYFIFFPKFYHPQWLPGKNPWVLFFSLRPPQSTPSLSSSIELNQTHD